MTDIFEELANTSAEHVRRPRPKHKDGWAPGIDVIGGHQVITSHPTSEAPDWNALIAEYLPPGFNPDLFEVDPDTIRFTAWDGWGRDEQGAQATSRKQFVFRGRILARRRPDAELDDLKGWMRRSRPKLPAPPADVDSALLVGVADLQIGKHDGDGVRGTMERFDIAVGRIEDRIKTLRPDSLYVLGLGDLIEGCSGHYPMQEFTTELNMRDQRRVVRRLLVDGLRRWSRQIGRIVVAPVGGNHGETRKDGKAFTDFADNIDVAVFEDVAEIFAENPDSYGHIGFSIPYADLTQTLQIGDTIVGIVHGHQFGAPSGNIPKRATDWWRGHMDGRQPIGDADLLISAHYHHLQIVQQGVRTWIQAPALDGGSDWFTSKSGLESPPGMLTLMVDDGWHSLQIV